MSEKISLDSSVPWYKNFRYISIALIIIALLEYWWFF